MRSLDVYKRQQDDGYFVIAFATADLLHKDTEYNDEFLVFGLVEKSVDAQGNEVWTGDLCAGGGYACGCEAVSYTHLDVYKRQTPV